MDFRKSLFTNGRSNSIASFRLVLCLLLNFSAFVLPVGTILFAQEFNPEDAINLKLEVELTRPLTQTKTTYRSIIKLGDLQAEQSYQLSLIVKNPFKKRVGFDKVNLSCGCSSIDKNSGAFPAEGATELKVNFKTHQSTKNGKFVFRAICSDSETRLVDLYFEGELINNLHIEKSYNFELGKDSATFRIPFVFSAPILEENLELQTDDSLKHLDFRLSFDEKNPVILVDVDKSKLDSDFVFGAVGVNDKLQKKSVKTNLMLHKVSAIQVSPRILRFRKSEKTKGFSTTLFVNVAVLSDKSKEVHKPRSGVQSVPGELVFKIEIEGCEVKKRQLSKGVYRLELMVPEASIEELKKNNEVNCWMSCGNATVTKSLVLSIKD